jgi:hypothetical protein
MGDPCGVASRATRVPSAICMEALSPPLDIATTRGRASVPEETTVFSHRQPRISTVPSLAFGVAAATPDSTARAGA